MPGPHWTEQEIASLIHQVVLENKPLPQLTVPGKSEAAINNQRRRLKEAGLLDRAFVGRTVRPWTICKLRELINLTAEYGRLMPSRQIAALWGVAQKTVNAYRRRLGISLSWQQARASQKYQESQQSRAANFIAQTRKRWRAWREDRTGALERRKQEFEQRAAPPPTRICAVCGQQSFATKDFYHVQTRRVGKRLKVTVSRTCRLCRSQQRRQKNLGQPGQTLVGLHSSSHR